MKYKTKEIIVEADRPNYVNYYVDGIGFIQARQFDLLFEPLEEDKQETFKCNECNQEYLSEVNKSDSDITDLCNKCYYDKF